MGTIRVFLIIGIIIIEQVSGCVGLRYRLVSQFGDGTGQW